MTPRERRDLSHRERQALSDRDLLIRLDERVETLERYMTNHLAHHWAVTIGLVLAVTGAIGSLVVALVTR